MKIAALAAIGSMLGSLPASAADRIGEDCSGSEIVRIGSQPPRTVPYKVAFSADLAAGTYCYDRCLRDQTYSISNGNLHPVMLADLHRGGQVRVTTFDRRTGVLHDHQVYDGGLARIARDASATCRAAPFREPAKLAGNAVR